MRLQDAVATLRRNELALRSRSVRHAALFGSVAGGENRPDGDIEILIDFDPDACVTIYDYIGVKDFIASLFDVHVDVVERKGLKPHLRQSSAQDAIDVF